jgi:hypothetical protein
MVYMLVNKLPLKKDIMNLRVIVNQITLTASKILTLQLENRSNKIFELCGKQDDNLIAYSVPPKTNELSENQVVICTACLTR